MLCLCLKCLLGLNDGTDSSGNEATGDYEQSDGCWELNLGPWGRTTSSLLTAVLSFQIQEFNFVYFIEKHDD